ncbi:MAG: beta-lactamase family protein [Undibacterium sp.]|nr:beta-lactamase family protein [Undibacterium sp.]
MTSKIRLSLFLTLMSAIGILQINLASATRSEQTFGTSLDLEVPSLLKKFSISNASIVKIEDGKISLNKVYGEQSKGVLATATTLYNVASMTKPITAEVVLRLASIPQDMKFSAKCTARKISLDERMSSYWIDPDIANDSRSELLSPRLSLSHKSGFPNWRYQTNGKLSFVHTPGEIFGYSGEGYNYLTKFVEKKSHCTFEELAQHLLFDPLSMKDTTYTNRDWIKHRIAIPTDAEGKELKPVIASSYNAADLLYSTTTDYAKLMVSVMQNKGLTDELAKQRMQVQTSRKDEICKSSKSVTCPSEVGIGLGWEVYQLEHSVYLMHTGKDEGIFTFAYINSTTRSGIVVFTSSENGYKIILPILDQMVEDKSFITLLHALYG